MNLSTSFFTPATALLGVALLSSFQSPPAQNPGQKPAGTPGAGQSGARPAPTATSPDPLSSQTMNLQRADRVVGMDLADSAGASIGRVQDLVLNADGSVAFVVVQGTGGKLYPISWKTLQFQTGTPTDATAPGAMGGKLTTNFTKDRIDTAPNFASGQWPNEGSDSVFTEADAFWGGSGASRVPAGSEKNGQPRDASMRTPVRLRSSTLGNTAITDPTGAPLGTLGEVVVDPASGRIAYGTLRLSGGNVVAVPWSLFQTSTDRKDQLQLAFPQDKLQTAPQFQSGEDHWKQMSDPAWVGQMYSYYSVQPYWKGSSRTPATTPPAGAGEQKSGGIQQPPTPKTSKPPSGG